MPCLCHIMTMNLNLPAIIWSQAVDPVITHCVLFNYIMTLNILHCAENTSFWSQRMGALIWSRSAFTSPNKVTYLLTLSKGKLLYFSGFWGLVLSCSSGGHHWQGSSHLLPKPLLSLFFNIKKNCANERTCNHSASGTIQKFPQGIQELDEIPHFVIKANILDEREKFEACDVLDSWECCFILLSSAQSSITTWLSLHSHFFHSSICLFLYCTLIPFISYSTGRLSVLPPVSPSTCD